MFPSSDQRSKDQHPAGPLIIEGSELSPPLSQDLSNQNDMALQMDDPMDMGPGPSESSAGNPMSIRNAISKGAEKPAEPGSAWNNRKAREEYARAMEQVVDKNFNLSESLRASEAKQDG